MSEKGMTWRQLQEEMKLLAPEEWDKPVRLCVPGGEDFRITSIACFNHFIEMNENDSGYLHLLRIEAVNE